jgi:hypothetical protein
MIMAAAIFFIFIWGTEKWPRNWFLCVLYAANPTKLDGICYIKNRRTGGVYARAASTRKNSILLSQMGFLVKFPIK